MSASCFRPVIVVLASLCIVSCTSAESGSKGDRAVSSEPDALLATFVSEFVEITPGSGRFPKAFRMGAAGEHELETTTHEVTFEHSFAIAKYETPQNLYEAVMGENPSRWRGRRNSVEMVTWQDANVFCRRVTAMLRTAELIAADDEIRLPTQAEWEYCCRAGTTTAYSFGDAATTAGDTGDEASKLNEYAWHTGNAAGNDPAVGALKPNLWGLYDMHGYLWEYVADAWSEDPAGAPADGSSRETGGALRLRVMRGGSWRDRHDVLRAATRCPIPDHVRSDAIGFRCVRAKVRADEGNAPSKK